MLQKFLLELEGRAAGKFFAFAGGSVRADVVTSGFGNALQKHVASVRFEDMTLNCGTGMSHNFYDWIGNSLAGVSLRKNGAIMALDQASGGARLEFSNALVSSLVMPDLDRSSNKAAYMSVKLTPELTRSVEQTGSPKTGVYASNLPKAWDIQSFRLQIDGLESECSHVTHIDSLQLGRKAVGDTSGGSSSPTNEATATDFSNLVIRLPEMYAKGFTSWFDDLVLKGKSGPGSEKKGKLEFFAPNSTKAYFELDFEGLGIFQLEGASGLRTKTMLPITVGMYCDSIKFSAGPAAIV